MGVQINGKTRGSIKLALDATEDIAVQLARANRAWRSFWAEEIKVITKREDFEHSRAKVKKSIYTTYN